MKTLFRVLPFALLLCLMIASSSNLFSQKKCKYYKHFPSTDNIYLNIPDSLKKATYERGLVYKDSFTSFMLSLLISTHEAFIASHLVKGDEDYKLCATYEVRHPQIKQLNTDSIYLDEDCFFTLTCENGDLISLQAAPSEGFGPIINSVWSTWLVHSYYEINQDQIERLSKSRVVSSIFEFKIANGEKRYIEEYKTRKGATRRFMNDCRCFADIL